ncbi:MAG: glycosyltransferase [Planctomycetes bacterium]|nr:glycosyltransferase [Planctomycetota bacterium]
MKILHVIPQIGRNQGGLSTGTIAICRAMQSVGIETELACLQEANDEAPAGIRVHRFKPGLRLTGASPAMRHWLHANADSYDAIVAHVVWLSPAHYAASAAAKAGIPLFLASHGMLDPDALQHHRLRKLIRWHLGVRKLIRRSVLVLSSEADRTRSLSHPELADSPTLVIPNPVAIPDKSTAPPNGEPMILCLNRLHPRKGVLPWVEALLQLRTEGLQFSATHAGNAEDPEYTRRVNQVASPLVKENRLRFLSAVPHDETRRLIGQSSIVVHPAVGFENFGLVITEAMGAARAVVASRRALVTPELEQAGVVLAAEPEPEHLADSIRRLLQDAAMRKRLGEYAREYAIRHFSYEVVGRQWLQALEATLSHP